MAHIPANDINQIWNQAPHDWNGLMQFLKSHQGEAKGIENADVDLMMIVVKNMQNSGTSFPQSQEDLAKTMDQEIDKLI